MEFKELLSIASQNREKKPTIKACYQTKFAPPKKETKQSKELSDNIKKFLARKEEEERNKALEEKKRKENLLALRDHKAQVRINKHLKVCKAANKSVLADAVDNENTAVTMAGPSQCDEDDYGYVSQEASAFYNKLMNKYSSLPPEKSLFSDDGKKTVKDIASTKDRVRQALKQQEIEDSSPHMRKRKRKASEFDDKQVKENGDSNHKDNDGTKGSNKESQKESQKSIKKKPMPPPMKFEDLLKIAEKKQYEPIKIEPKKEPQKEPERLMTKKQMREYAKEKDYLERKEKLKNSDDSKSGQVSSNKVSKSSSSSTSKLNSANSSSDTKTASKGLPTFSKRPSDRPSEKSSLSKSQDRSSTSSSSRPLDKARSLDKNSNVNKLPEKINGVSRAPERSNGVSSSRAPEKTNGVHKPSERSNGVHKSSDPKKSEKDVIAEERRKLEEEKRKLEEMRRTIEEEKKKLLMSKTKKVDGKPSSSLPQKPLPGKSKEAIRPGSKPLPPGVKSRPFPPADVKPRQFPPADVKPRQFPPPDVRSKPKPMKLKVNKRRICDDSDEEYDSELDDFIDDGPEEECADYSKYISEIFGYDKSKYRHMDDDDDAAMESNFAQQMREESISTKIGRMEDLEDMRQEAMEKMRKAQIRKKRKIA